MIKKISMLIVAAYPPELKLFCSLQKKYLKIKDDVAYLAAGIGPTAASFGLTHFLENYRPQKIIAIGTAGILNSQKFRIGEIVTAKSVSCDAGIEGAYVPQKMEKKYFFNRQSRLVKSREFAPVNCVSQMQTRSLAAECSTSEKNKEAQVFSPQEITCSESKRILLAKKHDVEHLESFAFAFVAKKMRIPISIYLGLTNTVGPNAHVEWKKNEQVVMSNLVNHLKSKKIV